MTVTTTVTAVTINGDGSATIFPFSPMIITENDDLKVTKVDTNGDETVLAEGSTSTTYSVQVNDLPNTGSITYPATGGTPLASGEKLVISRDIELVQETVLRNQGPYLPAVQEAVYDRFMLIIQDISEKVARSLKLKIGDDLAGAEIEMEREAGKFLRWDDSATTIIASEASVTTIASAADDTTPVDVSLTSGSPGVKTEYSRGDHRHLLPTVSVAKGGTGATDAATARTNLGLGSASVEDAGNTLLQLPFNDDIQRMEHRYNDSTGSAGNYNLTPIGASPTAYVAGQKFIFRANHANTGAVNLDVASLGDKDVKKITASGGSTPQELVAGDIFTNQIVEVVYDGTQFIVTSALPQASAGTGGWVVLSVVDPNGETNIDFDETLITNTYDVYQIVCSGIRFSGDQAQPSLRVGTGDPTTFVTTASYDTVVHSIDDVSVNNIYRASAVTSIHLWDNTSNNERVGNSSGETWSCRILIHEPRPVASKVTDTMFELTANYVNALNNTHSLVGTGRFDSVAPVTGIRLFEQGGDTWGGSSGKIVLMGMSNSV